MKKKLFLIGIAGILALNITGCSTNKSKDNTIKEINDKRNQDIVKNEEEIIENKKTGYELTEEGIIKPEFAKEIIKDIADSTMEAIANKNFKETLQFIHPEKGVRFTPYTCVSVENDIVFSKKEIKDFFENKEVYLWGHYDGIGSEIFLAPREYYDEFIYSADFINAEKVGYNQVFSSGNVLENQFKVYENPIVVEYYFSGFDPQYEGIDWKSLRLVFEEYKGDWKLVGIIHNQWTI